MAQQTKHRHAYRYLDSTVNTNQTIFEGSGTLHYITINQTTASTIGIIDGGGSVTNVLQLKASIAEGTYRYDVSIGNGCVLKPSGHLGNVTVCYSKG